MYLLSFFNNTAQVYVIEAEDFIKPDCSDLSNFLSVLSVEEKNRFNKYKNEKAQFTFLTARYYLRELLNIIISDNENLNVTQSSSAPNDNKVEQASCSLMNHWIATLPQSFTLQHPQSLQSLRDSSPTVCRGASSGNNNGKKPKLIIETSTSGKPYLKDYPNLFFNLSHTDNLILIAIANSHVGVDVEKNERNADKEAIIKHFFSEKEQQSFFSQPDEQRQLGFVKGWTRKEAILKATGEGLSAMKDYEVSFEPEAVNPIIYTKTELKFKVKDFTPKEGYAACLAVLEK